MTHKPLAISNGLQSARIPQRATPDLPRLTLNQPATATMTDFTRECPVAVSPDRHIDDALQDMIRAGVRALLVLEEGRLLGLITSYDIMGERPILFLQSPECAHDPCLHRDVMVADIMTRLDLLPRLEWKLVQSACVGDLIETFNSNDNTHLLVVEPAPDGESVVRGLISRTRLERQTAKLKAGAALDRVPHRDRLPSSIA